MKCLQLWPGKHRRMGGVSFQEGSAALRHAVLWGDRLDTRGLGGAVNSRTVEGDGKGDRA